MRRPILMCLISLWACGDRARTPGTIGPGPTKDAGPDAGSVDGASFDGASFDGTSFDAVVADSGAADGRVPDSGADGGAPIDSGAVDSGVSPYCVHTCGTPSDCVIPPGSGIADDDNYSCTGGRCTYLGCRSDTECMTTFSAPYVCRVTTGATGPTCVKACSVADDCAMGSTLFDAAHYDCVGGGCEWRGCFSDNDCATAFSNSAYRCASVPFLPFDNCFLGCIVPSDCVVGGAGPGFDADNYVCSAGICAYSGCTSTAECQAQAMSSDYVCGP